MLQLQILNVIRYAYSHIREVQSRGENEPGIMRAGITVVTGHDCSFGSFWAVELGS